MQKGRIMIDSKAFRSMSYGVYIISATDGQKAAGCVVNTLVQVTSKPARVSVAINKDNFTAGVVQRAGRFEAVVLAEDTPMELIGTFGFRSSADEDKFASCEHAFDEAGVPYVTEHAVAHMGVRVLEVIDAGTHMLFMGEVEEAAVLSGEPAMTYAYYHQVKGGKTPPKASSYEDPEAAAPAAEPAAAEPAKRYGWRCTICGYILEQDELPADFKCPICGMGPDKFERIEL